MGKCPISPCSFSVFVHIRGGGSCLSLSLYISLFLSLSLYLSLALSISLPLSLSLSLSLSRCLSRSLSLHGHISSFYLHVAHEPVLSTPHGQRMNRGFSRYFEYGGLRGKFMVRVHSGARHLVPEETLIHEGLGGDFLQK